MTNIFEINNLECKYPKRKFSVLQIEQLIIKSGSVVFFIGASGVGKSTILETLGLMNNTISVKDNTKFLFKTAEIDEDFTKIWKKGEFALSKFRSKHLSFIFQQTNLFPHLTVHENANIVQIIQGENYLTANQKIKKIFNALSLTFGKQMSPKVTNISGGQRQRIAFARAISTNYDILFADEPTGNLDWYNAENLMSILVNNVKSKKKTAIIVSHDISLALEHATDIVVIEKRLHGESDHHFGYISEKQVFSRDISDENVWINESIKTTKEDFKVKLKQIIKDQSVIHNKK